MSMLEYSEGYVMNDRFYKDIHKCKLCPYVTKSRCFMVNHVRRHRLLFKPFLCERSTPEIYYCKDCDFRTDLLIFLKKHILQVHISTTENEDESQIVEYTMQSFICQNCTFETHSALMWLQHGKTGCESENSLETTKNRNLLKKNAIQADSKLRVLESENRQWLYCEKCRFKTIYSHTLKKHLANHILPKCDKCSFSATTKNSLREHKKYHHSSLEKMKWYECAHCPYKSPREATFLTHQVIHKLDHEIKWYECDQCEYKSNRKGTLKEHVVYKHLDNNSIKWHKCPHCFYQGKTRKYIKSHLLRIHAEFAEFENINLLQCDKCSFKSKWKKTLHEHKIIHHLTPKEIQWFQCEKCPYEGKLLRYLRRHIHQKHTSLKDSKGVECDQGTENKHIELQRDCLYNANSEANQHNQTKPSI